MSKFPAKRFEGAVYTFDHLAPLRVKVPLNAAGTQVIEMQVRFGCHCFSETFDPALHLDHHRYLHHGELRAFSPVRYECSRQLPAIIRALIKGTIYHAGPSYTYRALITLPSADQSQDYWVFFSLTPDRQSSGPALNLFVKSAYLKPHAPFPPHARNWRFPALAGQIAGVFQPKAKKPRPHKKKKAP